MGRKGQQKRKASYAVRTTPIKRQYVARAPPRNATISPFPIRQTRTITYCDAVRLNPTAGQDVATYVFRANSIFDPDKTGVGHKPYAHDTFETLYSNYSVKSAVIDIQFAPDVLNPGAFKNCMVGVWNNDSTFTITDPTLVREQPGSTSKLLTVNDPISVRGQYMRNSRIPVFDQGEASAAFGANPVEILDFNIFMAGEAADNLDNNNVVAFLKITYEVEMWDPKKLGASS
ncbi:MAG: putative capsid protein [Cressdnaviricota sp.]|nr:MAG: putative capsid protein [Cressdnaviricota sp.]